MKLLVSAAETSADLHAAQVVAALRRRFPGIRVIGIGGPALRAQGLEAVAQAEDLAVMGSLEVLSKLKAIRAARKAILELSEREKPEVALLVDYPGFHFSIASRLKALGTKIAYFIPPKVWVWRRGRLNRMKKWVSRVFCILPFEQAIYEDVGIPSSFVGSPLMEELPWEVTREQARAHLGWSNDEKILAVLPGSRAAELKNHLAVFLEAARAFALRRDYRVVVALPEGISLSEWKTADLNTGPSVEWLSGSSGWVLRAADLGLIKSGTATLEAAILECPMVVAYRPSVVTSWAVRNLLRYRAPVALANLYELGPRTQEKLIPEILHEEVTAARLERELLVLVDDAEALSRMRSGLSRIRKLAQEGSSGRPASEQVADGLMDLLGLAHGESR